MYTYALYVIITVFCISNYFAPVYSQELYTRAPDVIPGTIPEMRTTKFWIARMQNPDEVIVSLHEIEKMNAAYEAKMKLPEPFKGEVPERIPENRYLHRWPGRILTMPDLDSMTSEEISASVHTEIKKDREYLRSTKFGTIHGIEYADFEIDRLEKEIAEIREEIAFRKEDKR